MITPVAGRSSSFSVPFIMHYTYLQVVPLLSIRDSAADRRSWCSGKVAFTCDFAVQQRVKNVAFAVQHRVLCNAAVRVLQCTTRKMSPENAAATYQRTGPHRLKLERQ